MDPRIEVTRLASGRRMSGTLPTKKMIIRRAIEAVIESVEINSARRYTIKSWRINIEPVRESRYPGSSLRSPKSDRKSPV
jgi:hypothetical protein